MQAYSVLEAVGIKFGSTLAGGLDEAHVAYWENEPKLQL